MSNFSQALKFEWSEPDKGGDQNQNPIHLPSLSNDAPNLADRIGGSRASAEAAQYLGRINSARASDREHKSLLDERQKLLDLKFSGSATRRDLNRLTYVRWSLDRIELARDGSLDQLEAALQRYEQFSHDLEQLNASLASTKSRRAR